jgi:glycosyltransferase involved in cell wall biosynthesis
MPKISVLMTTLNSEKYISEAIESILHQTFENFELVIVDGGSNDNTINIINKFDDKRIRLFVVEGLRRSAQLNYGVEKSVGEFIAIMDSDDIALPERLKLQSEFLQANENINVVGTWAYLVSEDGEYNSLFKRPTRNNIIISQLLAMNGICFGTICFKRDLAEKNKFNEKLNISEDIEWFLRLSAFNSFANLPIPLMKLRQVKKSRSRYYPVKNQQLLESMEEYLIKKLNEANDFYNRVGTLRDLGLINYYYGSLKKARKYLLSSFFLFPVSILTIRYLVPILIFPEGIFEKVRNIKLFRKLAAIFRKIFV